MARVEFRLSVKRLAAERVGYFCSRPNCPNPYTVGPLGDESRTCLGDAAHIRAASGGGPRPVEGITEDELRAVENAIWLCARCHRLADSDDSRFTIDELERWKAEAEQRALDRMEGLGIEPGVRVPDLLPPEAGVWRVGLVAQIALSNLGVGHVEQALRSAIDQSLSVLVPNHRGPLAVLLDEDGLVVEHRSEDGPEGLRVRATQLGQLEMTVAFPFGPGVESEALPMNAERSVDIDKLAQAVSFLTRTYCAYGRHLAGTRNTLPGVFQVLLLDVERAALRVPSELLGGTGDAVGVATVDQVFTPVGSWQLQGPVGGLPALEQTVRAVFELCAFFRNRWHGLSPVPTVLHQRCVPWHS